MSTLYGSFTSLDNAQRAVGALLDQGANSDDVSLVANEPSGSYGAQSAAISARLAESEATKGISTTTAGDAIIGAEKGAIVGVGIGTVAALVSMAIPGIGIVVGGGALLAAIVAAAGTTAAGAVAGGVAGYLKDQGMGPEVATRYSTAFEKGGTILAITVPSGSLLPEFAEQLLSKYGATDIATVNGSRTLIDYDAPREVSSSDNPTLAPLTTPASAKAAVAYPPTEGAEDLPSATAVVEYVPQEVLTRATIRPTLVDPVTGMVSRAVLLDPYTGFEREIRYADDLAIYVDPSITEHPVVTEESDTVLHADDPSRPTITLTGSERVTIL